MGITEPCYHQALTAEHARLSTQSTLPSCLRDWNGLSVAASLGGKGEEARELTPNPSGTNWLKAVHIAAALVAWTIIYSHRYNSATGEVWKCRFKLSNHLLLYNLGTWIAATGKVGRGEGSPRTLQLETLGLWVSVDLVPDPSSLASRVLSVRLANLCLLHPQHEENSCPLPQLLIIETRAAAPSTW